MALVIPTDLTKEQIAEFKMLYKKHFDIDMTDEETRKEGVQFLQFMTAVIDNNEAFFDE